MRVGADAAAAEALAEEVTILPLAPRGRWLAVLEQSGATNVDWLLDAAEQLLLDAGLIGLPRDDLRALLERRAAEAMPSGLSYRPFIGEDDAAFCGLSARTTFYDLLRAVHDGLALAARDAYATLGLRPRQVRIAGAGALASRCLAASLEAPLLTLECEAPAAAGAALVAAVSLGQYRDVAEAGRAWIEPRLRAVERTGPKGASRLAQRALAAPS